METYSSHSFNACHSFYVAGSHKLDIPDGTPGKDNLTPEELLLCQTLRFMPEVYLHMKKTMLNAVYTYGPYKKRDAQMWFRVDVNKTSQVYEWFRVLGWIPSSVEEWNELLERRD